ncbi:MAG: hypothetical protein AAFN81_32255, partial [Bacteroidota bacterium]
KDENDVYSWLDITSKASSLKRLSPITKTIADDGTTLTLEELDDGYIRVDTNAGPVTLNIPLLALSEDGLRFRIKRIGTNPLTLVASAPQTIELAPLIVYNLDRLSYTFIWVNDANDLEIH